MRKRHICIHGHFYQPPRENPWIEAVEIQDSARPYHDWNERITAECYGPNGASRILDQDGYILKIVNNYERISFDFGPTLLSWLEFNAPEVYRSILEADRLSQARFSGHGSAMAQVYNHIIMPLANRRDKETQVRWGIADFEYRFRRAPEGMWLAETAVDLETLEIMAEQGIAFTILSPTQARRVRPVGEETWTDVSGGRVDTTRAYRVRLSGGRSIAVFFYHAPISQAVAFERLLDNGEHFAHRMISAFSDEARPQLVHVATDGETYGHHHFKGDMALAYALHTVESTPDVSLTNYGEFLDRYPPEYEVEIVENTAWSCSHGVGRWREDCGCNAGTPGFNQRWRTPLRETLDWLRDQLGEAFETRARAWLKEPWKARDAYIDLVLDRSADHVERFLKQHGAGSLSAAGRVAALKALEAQRHALLMYTSCGWFFDELSGIETVQVLQYAARAIQLAAEVYGLSGLEREFRSRLRAAKSNLPEMGDGEGVYLKKVEPAMVDLAKVAAHYALSSLFRDYPESVTIHAYALRRRQGTSFESGRNRMSAGCVEIGSERTGERKGFTYCAVGFGDHNLLAGVRPYRDDDAYEQVLEAFRGAAERADSVEAVRILTREFQSTYTIRSLFRDEQRQILQRVLDTTLAEEEAVYRRLYNRHLALMKFVHDLGSPLPLPLYIAARYILNVDLLRAIGAEPPDLERARELAGQARAWQIKLDAPQVGFALGHALEKRMARFMEDPAALAPLVQLQGMLELARSFSFDINLWRTQNTFCRFLERRADLARTREDGRASADEWRDRLRAIGKLLEVRVDAALGGAQQG